MRAPSLITIVCLAAAASSLAANAPTAPLPATADAAIGKICSAPVFRQFDFWLGRWTVTNAQGAVVGHSRITRISQGCAIHERWLGRRSTGNSLNYYDHATHQWHQDWVGGGGQVLHLHGGRRSESMVLGGTRRDKRGKVLDRITWTPMDGHRVRQHWQVSRDDGRTWHTLFLGIYTPQPESAAP
jgi:hypothetical protein